jgi:ADP-ribosylglycohydrolase
MVKKEAERYYGQLKELEFEQKVPDMHRQRWEAGDWTDDSDQMILIMRSLLEMKQMSAVDFACKLKEWAEKGFSELGDHGGMGIGSTTVHVLRHEKYDTDPHSAAADIWEKTGKFVAPNGAVMRTSILGIYQYENLEQVKENTLTACKITHADPRCQASCVAVTRAIALMLQRPPGHLKKDGSYNVNSITKEAYDTAKVLIHDRKTVRDPINIQHKITIVIIMGCIYYLF